MIGVLVMAHGTPASPEAIGPFYTSIRRGRPPSDEQLADLVRRYDAIGGLSPLAERTAAQVAGIAAALDGRYDVRYGAKHGEPSIEQAAADLRDHDAVVGLVLTPHASPLGSGEYLTRAAAILGERFVPVTDWYRATRFAGLVAERLNDALLTVHRRPFTVLFTAHSLPERILPDPYPEQVAQSGALVAHAAGIAARGVDWQVAWQSAGRTPEPWIGPGLLEVLGGLEGSVVVCPIGFVSDHLEVLYDIDIEAQALAAARGLDFARTASLNDDPGFCAVLAGVVRDAADG